MSSAFRIITDWISLTPPVSEANGLKDGKVAGPLRFTTYMEGRMPILYSSNKGPLSQLLPLELQSSEPFSQP